MSRRPEWPEWWGWELDFGLDHLRDQMTRREFSETDLREMLERATNFREDEEFGRWLIETVNHHQPWAVIVEPQVDDRILLVITAYRVEPLL
jgi:hypothetical protein